MEDRIAHYMVTFTPQQWPEAYRRALEVEELPRKGSRRRAVVHPQSIGAKRDVIGERRRKPDFLGAHQRPEQRTPARALGQGRSSLPPKPCARSVK